MLNLPVYKVFDFKKSKAIGVICKGASLSYLPKIASEFSECFLIGNCSNTLLSVGKYIKKKNAVLISNKNQWKISYSFYGKYVCDIQCSRARNLIKLQKNSSWAMIHKPVNVQRKTTGMYAVNLASQFNVPEIHIIGLDFFYSKFYRKERAQKSNVLKYRKKISKQMIKLLYKIVKTHKHTKFYLYTFCPKIKSRSNLLVKFIK